MATVFTIGHSDHPIGRFLELLQEHRVEVVADIRTRPYSRRNPQYNRKTLDAALRAVGLSYEFLGDLLGGRPDDPACYRDGQVDYELVAGTDRFRKGLHRLLELASTGRVAIMCAERDPIDCHRMLLVGRHLAGAAEEVLHIHAGSAVETQPEALERLIAGAVAPPAQGDLLRNREEVEAEAYRYRANRVAWASPRTGPRVR